MMDRRQGTNNFYISLCTAMLTVIVAFVATKVNTFAWSAVTIVISGMMLFICDNWKKTLEAYGVSNQAKYEVLNSIEEKLPALIFESEWEYGKTINYSSYSKRESLIPEIFTYLFCFIMLVMIIVFVLTAMNIYSIKNSCVCLSVFLRRHSWFRWKQGLSQNFDNLFPAIAVVVFSFLQISCPAPP